MNFKKLFSVFLFLLLPFFAQAGAKPRVTGAWIREGIPGQGRTAAYMIIENPDSASDFLVSASCSCAKAMEIHTMIHDGAVIKMDPVKRLEIPGGGKVELTPGGTHIMLFGVKMVLKDGVKTVLTLHFEKAGDVEVEATVRALEGKKDAG